MGERALDARQQRAVLALGDQAAQVLGALAAGMHMGGVEDGAAQQVGVGIEELEFRDLLGMRVEQPRMVDQRQEDQRLARRQRGARAAHQR